MNRDFFRIGLMSSCVMAVVALQTRAVLAASADGDALVIWNANAAAATTAACIAPLASGHAATPAR